MDPTKKAKKEFSWAAIKKDNGLVYPLVERELTTAELADGSQIERPYAYLEKRVKDEDVGYKVADFIQRQQKLTNDYLNLCPADLAKILEDRLGFHDFNVRIQLEQRPIKDDANVTPFKLNNVSTVAITGHLKKRIYDMHNYDATGTPRQHGGHLHRTDTPAIKKYVSYMIHRGTELKTKDYDLVDKGSTFYDNEEALCVKSAYDKQGCRTAFVLKSKEIKGYYIQFQKCGSDRLEEDIIQPVSDTTDLVFTHDGEGIFYSKYDRETGQDRKDNEHNVHRLMYHRIGTDGKEDIEVYADESKEGMRSHVSRSECGSYLILRMAKDAGRSSNGIKYLDMRDKSGKDINRNTVFKPQTLVDNLDNYYSFVGSTGSKLIFTTSYGSPNYSLIQADIADPSYVIWNTLVERNTDDKVLKSAFRAGETKIVLHYTNVRPEDRKHGVDELVVFDVITGQRKNLVIPVPEGEVPGHVINITCQPENDYLYVKTSSPMQPGPLYRCSLADENPTLNVYLKSKIDFRGSDYVVKSLEYVTTDSKDGSKTKVMMTIAHKKDAVIVKGNGTAPAIVKAYGGFGNPLIARFGKMEAIFMEVFGGVLAYAHIRGGGEHGKEWHDCAKKENKYKSVDDICAAADFLIDQGYAHPDKIAGCGASNGGLMFAATANRKNNRYSAVLNVNGVYDLTGFTDLDSVSAKLWTGEYGDPNEAGVIGHLKSISPLHNIKSVKTKTWLFASGQDTRVDHSQTFKYLAAAQYERKKQHHKVTEAECLMTYEETGDHSIQHLPLPELMAAQVAMLKFLAIALELTW